MGDLLLTKSDLFTVPNALTLLRLLASPALALCACRHQYGWVVGIFFFAGWSDWLDGFWARRFGCVSPVGAFLDPLADKCLTFCAYVALFREFPLLSSCVIGRDVLILLAVGLAFVLRLNLAISPVFISKVNTGFVLLFPFLWFFQKVWPWAWISPLFPVLEGIIAVTLAGSFGAYICIFVRAIRAHG